MRNPVFVVLFLLTLAGCGGGTTWVDRGLAIGGEAAITGREGPNVTVEELAKAPKSSSRAKSTVPPKVESSTLAAGTRVLILAIDGDEARVQIKDGPRVGATLWLATSLLDPVGP